MRHRLPADVLLLITVLIWSFHFAVIKYGLTHGFAPLAYATVRFGIGSLLFAAITYGRERTLAVQRRDLWLLLVVASATLFVSQTAFAYATQLTTASTVALVFGTLPIFVVIFSRLIGTERGHARHWLAAALSFGGVALVAAGAQGGLSGDLGGILVGIFAPLTWAIYSILIGSLMRRYSPYRLSAVAGLAAIVPLAAISVPQLVHEDWSSIGWLAWAALAYSTVLSFVVTNVLWFTAIDRVGANRSSLYVNLQPFLGALFAVVILSESLGVLQLVGGAVIGGGILLARGGRVPVAGTE